MFKIMIVDDEPLIREGLRTIVDWETYGFEVAGVAVGGLDALEKLPRLRPDLMIVDIRMPGMDGLELMRAIREREWSAPRFVVLSGYADFEYARQALEMKADAYVLKPVEEEELVEALVRLKRALVEEAAEANSALSPERAAISLLAGEGEGGPPPAQAVDAIRLGEPPYRVVLIRPQSREELGPAAAVRVQRRLCELFDARVGKGVSFSLDANAGLVLAGDADLASAYRSIARACADAGVDGTAVGGPPVERLEELNRSYHAALEGMKRRFLLAGDRIHRAEETASQPASGQTARGLGTAEEETLLLALDSGSAEAAAAWIRRAGEAMRVAGMEEAAIKSGFAQLFTQALAKLEQRRPDTRERCRAFAAEVPALYQEYRYSALIARLTKLAGEMTEAFRCCDGDHQVQRMIELIGRHYAENLRLESLADVFGYNSAYLGKLFKSKTGEAFNAYLDKVRIDKAKELLEQGLKVYQVAERVGYCSVDYFHGKFRKYVGVSPTAYRKHAD